LGGAHQLNQFELNQLDDLLAGVNGLVDGMAHGFFRKGVDKILHHAEIDVRLKQGQANLAHGLADVIGRKAALAAQFLEYVLKL
jgi:hypothetical protein